MRSTTALAACGIAILEACSSVSASSTPLADQCQPRQVVTCECLDGVSGTQSCIPDGGGYTPCVCGGDAGPSGDDGGGD
jgi:hypothetical protein